MEIKSTMASDVHTHGFTLLKGLLGSIEMDELIESLGPVSGAGQRGMLAHKQVIIAMPGLVLKSLTGWSPKIEHTFVYRKDRDLPALQAFRKILAAEKHAREKRNRS